jgi:hypothetical protein
MQLFIHAIVYRFQPTFNKQRIAKVQQYLGLDLRFLWDRANFNYWGHEFTLKFAMIENYSDG